jgi:hypothetical protein
LHRLRDLVIFQTMQTLIALLLILLTSAASASPLERIIQDARTVYAPLAQKTFRKPLHIIVTENNSVSASADHGYEELKVEINSGLLKSPRLTADALRMVICHELGHLFGGDPKRNIPVEWDGPIGDDGMSLLSAEGQADYYAGKTCFRLITKGQINEDRISEAGLKFLTLVMDFPISISTPDQTISPVLIRDSYPGRQCRLDTIVLGGRNLPRPACWFPTK